jgi:hypothetical protein
MRGMLIDVQDVQVMLSGITVQRENEILFIIPFPQRS